MTGTIFFSAQFYRRRPARQDTLDEAGPYRLYRIQPDGSGLRALTDRRHDALAPRLSPDGRSLLLAWNAQRGGAESLVRFWPRSARVEKLLGSDGRGWEWSPDGHHLASLQGRFDAWELHVLDLRTRQRRVWRGLSRPRNRVVGIRAARVEIAPERHATTFRVGPL